MSEILIEENIFKKGALYFFAKQVFIVCDRIELMLTVRIKVVFPDILEPVNNRLLLLNISELGTQLSIKGWIISSSSMILFFVNSGLQVCKVSERKDATEIAASISPKKQKSLFILSFSLINNG